MVLVATPSPAPTTSRIINLNNRKPNPPRIAVHPDGAGSSGYPAQAYGSGPPKLSNTLKHKPAALKIPVDGSTAKLAFYNDSRFPNFVAGLGPNPSSETTYIYPCYARVGAATFGWNIQASSGGITTCGDVRLVNLRRAPTPFSSLISPASHVPQSKSLYFSKEKPQAIRGDLIVSPQKTLTLIHAFNDNGNLVIDVLVGAITVKSTKNQTGILVSVGNRYIDFTNSQYKVEKINLEKAVKAPSVQDFLKLNEWSSDAAATQLVKQFQEALGQASGPFPRPTVSPFPGPGGGTVAP